jgi:ubiquinone/menaquinone biosynthesis C-methylase UbiE
MRSFQGKTILSFIRNGNYAHAGEEEAILKVFDGIQKCKNQKILDVGCGKGGTAKFVQDHGWGSVTGIDVEAESIEFACTSYPDIKFYCSDVTKVDSILSEKYDLIYLFNSFYEFSDQEAALSALRKVAHDKTILIIFDYIDLTSGEGTLIIRNDRTKITNPISLSNFDVFSKKTRWEKISYEDITCNYKEWYQSLLNSIVQKQDTITKKFGESGYCSACKRYTDLLNALEQGEMAGGIIKARTIAID